MHQSDSHDRVDERSAQPDVVSRRSVLGAAVVLSGASLLALTRGDAIQAAPAQSILGPTDAALTYVTLDAFAFHVADTSPTTYRLYQDVTGMEPQPSSRYIQAPLTIPIGSVVKQINVGYQGQPIISLARRPLDGMIANMTTPTTVPSGGGPQTTTLDVSAELTHGASYSVRAFCTAGSSVLGMTIGYAPPAGAPTTPPPVTAPPTPVPPATPAQGFVPYSGTAPRVLDTRTSTRLAPLSEIVVDLSSHVAAGARAAVLNITAVNTSGRGYLAVFEEGVAWPGNASVNFSAPEQDVGNGVIAGMTGSKIRVRTGPASTHVVVDFIGSLL